MTKDDALKLALEAFEAIPEEIEGWIPDKCTDAVIAIKEALAQPEQEPTNIERHEVNVQKFLGEPQLEQKSLDGYFLPISALNEPMKIGIEKLIAHAKQARWTNAIVRKDSVETSYEADWIKSLVKHTTPPQRTWVGLTDEEIAQGCKDSWVTEQAWQSAVWWAEAKLKEKNNAT